MSQEPAYCVTLTTCGSQEQARELAARILRERLAACIQLLDIFSLYEWEDAVQQDPEVLMLIKTRTQCYPDLEQFITAHHPYEVPEIIRLPIEGGLPAYLGWIDTVTRA